MPIYTYGCEPCERYFETMTTSFKAKPDKKCPRCGKAGVRIFDVPNVITHTTFFRGAKLGAAAFANDDAETRFRMLQPSKQAGVSIEGKTYQPGLARFPGDPRAFVEPDLHAIRKVCRERGLRCQELGTKIRDDGPPPEPTPIAEDIVQRECQRLIQSGEMSVFDIDKKREEIADRLAMPHLRGKYKRPRKLPKKARKR